MKGKLVVVWNGVEHPTGSTTVAVALATALSWTAFKKVLIMSINNTSDVSEYIKDDIVVKHSLDNLVFLGDSMTKHSIKMHSTSVNEKLDMIKGYQLDSAQNENSKVFEGNLIDKALEDYEYLVVDLSNNQDEEILKRADMVLTLLPFNNMLLETLSNDTGTTREFMIATEYINGDNAVCIFNNIPEQLTKELAKNIKNNKQVPIGKFNCLVSDPNILYYSCIKNSLYGYIVDNLKLKDTYIQNLLEIMTVVLENCDDYLIYPKEEKSWADRIKGVVTRGRS